MKLSKFLKRLFKFSNKKAQETTANNPWYKTGGDICEYLGITDQEFVNHLGRCYVAFRGLGHLLGFNDCMCAFNLYAPEHDHKMVKVMFYQKLTEIANFAFSVDVSGATVIEIAKEFKEVAGYAPGDVYNSPDIKYSYRILKNPFWAVGEPQEESGFLKINVLKVDWSASTRQKIVLPLAVFAEMICKEKYKKVEVINDEK